MGLRLERVRTEEGRGEGMIIMFWQMGRIVGQMMDRSCLVRCCTVCLHMMHFAAERACIGVTAEKGGDINWWRGLDR